MGGCSPAVNLGNGRTPTAIAVGKGHTCALLDNGALKCWGKNSDGQLGMGDIEPCADMGDAHPAVDLGTGRTATAITAGGYHLPAVNLGNGTPTAIAVGKDIPVAIAASSGPSFWRGGPGYSCVLFSNGRVKCWGATGGAYNNWRSTGIENLPYSLDVEDLGTARTATAIAVGWRHTCAILNGGDLKCLGIDSPPFVDLGTGRTVTAVAVGYFHTCAILDNGKLKCWGENDDGQLGRDGDGSEGMGDDLPVVNLGTGRTVTAIAIGGTHTCALLDNGKLKCWGQNEHGQLGLGRTADDVEVSDEAYAIDLGTGRIATAIAAGNDHTCALLDNGKLKCWGRNDDGQLGLGDNETHVGDVGDALPYVDLGTNRNATAIAAGIAHTCAILDGGQLKCWGLNSHGQLGLGDSVSRGDDEEEMGNNLPVVELGSNRRTKAISSGGYHNCAPLDNDSVKCWGMSREGQLGIGKYSDVGDRVAHMDDNLPSVQFDPPLPTPPTWPKTPPQPPNPPGVLTHVPRAVMAGVTHTCVIFTIGRVKCWGLLNTNSLIQSLPYIVDYLDLGTGRTATAIAVG
eukprot:gene21652-28665_t